ncbi:hypothetical protein BJ878DRAFT_425764 [Calycina marina]|uniref:Zn(2)-C6 fungal-type domain-containing protein n=1 Tax=Calycina marina TaxID=1763456 RepID=A0A9P8CD94_9HELO|nr:hypothetical protein BJ878DRAFT_425764 [Calycina marina]
MPPRKSHKKSKAGCQRCKRRKIKCDEVHPTCGNCSKHGVGCDFSVDPLESPLPPSSTSIQWDASQNPGILTPASTSTIVPFYKTPVDVLRSADSAATRTLELRLMHHYTALTSKTFADSKAEEVAWQVYVPSIAYNAEYLMDAIMAVAALHLRALNPADQSLVRASHGYMASSLAQYSLLLRDGVIEGNAEALFTTATLIAFQSSASRRFEAFDGDYGLPLSWFHSYQGIKTVVMASWHWLMNSVKVYPIISAQPALRLDLDPGRTSFFAPLLEGMEETLELEPESMREDTKKAYEHAVGYLNWAHKKPERRRVLGFAATVSRRFTELVEAQDPRAMVIVACFFAMTKIVDDAWWLYGVAAREVTGIHTLLPEEWWPKMEWSVRVATHEGFMTDDAWGMAPGVQDEQEQKIKSDFDMLAGMMNCNAPPMDVD